MKNKRNKNGFFSKLIGIDNIKNGFNYTKFSINRLIEESSLDESEENFRDACIKHGIVGSNDDINNMLEKKYKEIRKLFYYKFSFSVIIMLISFYYLFFSSFLNFLMCFLLSLTIFVYSLKEGLYCYQINQRELNLSKFWIKRPKLWFPKSFKKHENWEILDLDKNEDFSNE